MTRLALLAFVLLTGCLGDEVSREEFDAVLSRLDALESAGRHGGKHRGGHGDKKGTTADAEGDKPDSKPSKSDGKGDGANGAPTTKDGSADAGKIPVEVGGDAESVSLMRQRTRYTLPGAVPQGQYSILATFDGEEVEAGSAKIGGAGPVKISCKAGAKKCQVR